MERQIATIDPNGQLKLPDEVQAALGVHTGSRVEFSIQGKRVTLQLVPAVLEEELHGMFASGPSLEDDLFRDRDVDKW